MKAWRSGDPRLYLRLRTDLRWLFGSALVLVLMLARPRGFAVGFRISGMAAVLAGGRSGPDAGFCLCFIRASGVRRQG